MSDHTLTMEDLVEAYAFDESNDRTAKHDEITTGPASRRFREAKEQAERSIAAEIRKAKAEGFYEAANCLHVLNCGCMAHIGFVNPYAEHVDE